MSARPLRLVRAGLALGELPAHHALDQVLARLETEDLVGELDRAGRVAVEGGDIELHHALSSTFASRPLPAAQRSSPAARNLPGFGASFGSARLTASRTKIQPPFDAGNRALDEDQPALDVGLHDAQVLRGHALDAEVAGHLLVLERLARILAAAGRTDASGARPTRRAMARRPPKFQRFMPPAKPLPVVVPVTSTNWPATKWSAVISAPTGISVLGTTRNSASLRFGSTLATAKRPRSAFETFLTLALPTPSCSAV